MVKSNCMSRCLRSRPYGLGVQPMHLRGPTKPAWPVPFNLVEHMMLLGLWPVYDRALGRMVWAKLDFWDAAVEQELYRGHPGWGLPTRD